MSRPPIEDALLAGWLPPGVRFRGPLVFQGRVLIDGHLQGSVRADDLVEVGPEGRVDGEIEAPQVLVGGAVDGAVVGRERVTLLGTATVVGRLVTPWLDVRTGARLRAEVSTWHD